MTNSSDALRPCQFSLRTLLLAVLLISLPLSWFGAQLDTLRREERAVEAFRELGARVCLADPSYDPYRPFFLQGSPPCWLRRLLGRKELHSVQLVLDSPSPDDLRTLPDISVKHLDVFLSGLVDDECLVELSRFDNVTVTTNNVLGRIDETRFPFVVGQSFSGQGELGKLTVLKLVDGHATDRILERLRGRVNPSELIIGGISFQRSGITDAGLTHLETMPNLRLLSINPASNITDAGLKHLAKLPNLEEIKLLSGSRITDAGLEHLSGLAKLEVLSLAHGEVTDNGLECLKSLANLRELVLYASADEGLITDAGLAHLSQMKNLRLLSIGSNPKITDAGLQHIGDLTGLETLRISGWQITDAGLAQLKGLTNLKSLSIGRCPGITGSGLVHLQVATELNALRLWEDGIKGSELRHLSSFSKLKRLWLADMQADCNDLEHLTELGNLEALSLPGMIVSDSAISRLQRALPDCRIRR